MAQMFIIKPDSPKLLINLREIWRFRELFLIFAWRDIKVRYKQTFLGLAWVIFQPLLTSSIFTIFFGNLAEIPSGELPYSLFVLTGLVFWLYFSTGLTHASNSMIENEHIIKKVYFPKLILPVSSVVTASIDFAINLVLLVIIALFMGYRLHPLSLLILPINIMITFLSASSLGLILSALNVKFRDVRYILPFFIQTALFLTPIIYPTSITRPNYRFLMALNPMTSVIESTRQLFSTAPKFQPELYLVSLAALAIFTMIGLTYFRSTEKYFADIV